MTIFGLAIGVLAAFFVGHLLSGLIFGVTTTDSVTYAVVCVLLICIALFASVIPAYRAARLDPIGTLRDE